VLGPAFDIPRVPIEAMSISEQVKASPLERVTCALGKLTHYSMSELVHKVFSRHLPHLILEPNLRLTIRKK
jgi:hypothetical protein